MDGIGKPARGGHIEVKAFCDEALIHCIVAGIEVELQHTFVLAAQKRQDAVRGQLLKGLGKLEVVLELRALGLLALDHTGIHGAGGVHALAYLTH